MNKPRILIIENSIATTGALKAILKSANDLRSEFEFLFVVPKKGSTDDLIIKNGFRVVMKLNMVELRKSFLSVILYLPFLFINARKLIHLIKKHHVDLVHVNDLYNLLPPTIKFFRARVPYICHIRFLPNRFPNFIFRFWLNVHLKQSEKIIVVSNALKYMLPNHSKIQMIYDTFPDIKKQRSSETKNDNYTFLYLSNLIRGKGQDLALAAFSKIYYKIPQWKIRFVGGDMGYSKNQLFANQLIEMATDSGFIDKIELIPFTDDVESEYMAADISLNFSESESFSMNCLEALYCGIPVIASDSGGPQEIIDHMVTGLIVPNKEIEAMADAMMMLATDKQLRSAMACKAQASIESKFAFEKTSARLCTMYKSSLIKE